MSSFTFKYKLFEAGWAEATVQNEDKSVTMTASYLHDSLCEVADCVNSLIQGSDSASAVFMDEPGEHHLIFYRRDKDINYEIRWFEDWASWGMYPKDKYEIIISGNTTLKRVTGEIYSALKNIFETHGVKKYKKLWCKHDFPLHEYDQLKLLRKTEI